ncbi:MAG: hypothetical protein JO330_17290 [Mycobacteriaceae bacterium]|nr:hypothetical protein [Mycobacteriaceae bacterium]
MDYRITADDRARFKRCRRQWDFASPNRRDLEPVGLADPAVPAALTDALAVYYYPGTWDWPRELTYSLVHKALVRSLDEAGAMDQLEAAGALLDCYDAWAQTVDDFAPMRIGHDLGALVPDPREPGRGLSTAEGSAVIYTCRVDLLAVDSADEYWVVRHQVVDDWQDTAALVRDEEAVAACWAWEQDYLGMQIAGTMHNEVRVGGPLDRPAAQPEGAPRVVAHPQPEGTPRAVAQHEPSGGGRSIPQHVRVSARTPAHRAHGANPTQQRTAGVLRRTRIRRTRTEIDAVGRLIGAEALDMISDPAIYPTYAAHCDVCAFRVPCLALTEGSDPQPLLANGFRRRPVLDRPKPRLGQATWGFGRGAAPPQW